MSGYREYKYKTWLRKSDKTLVTWSNYNSDLREFCNGKNENYVFIGKLQANQNEFKTDEKGVYRMIRGKKKYYYHFTQINNICIMKSFENGNRTAYAVKTRYNYSEIETLASGPGPLQKMLKHAPISTLSDAVKIAKKFGEKMGVPVCVSTSLLNKKETIGLSIFNS